MFIKKYFGGNQTLYLILIIVVIFVLYKGFAYVGWNITVGGRLTKLFGFIFLLFSIFSNRNSQQLHFSGIIPILMLLPLFSTFNSWAIYHQPLMSGFWEAMSYSFLWGFYFVLHYFKVKEKTILRAFLYISIFVFLVQIIQQLTYPHAFFGILSEEQMVEEGKTEMAEMRNGLWRFRMNHNAYFTALILFYAWILIRKKLEGRLVFLILALLVSVYLTLTRQVMFSLILCIYLSFFIGKEKINLVNFFIGIFILLGIYVFYDILLSNLVEDTQNHLDDNVRYYSAAFYWSESCKSLSTFLFGYGHAVSGSFQLHMDVVRSIYHFYASDVGFIGMIWQYGVLYVLCSYYVLYAIYFKYKKYTPLYLRLYVLFTAIMSVMIFPMFGYSSVVVWCLMMYICDIHIDAHSMKKIRISNGK